MNNREQESGGRLHEATVLWGFLLGLFTGALGWLWLNPRSGREWREGIATQIERNPLEERLAEGRAAVQELRQQQDSSDIEEPR